MKAFPQRIRAVVFVVLAIAAAEMGGRCVAQSPDAAQPQEMQGLKVREIHPQPTPTPFPLDAETGRRQTLEFRPPDRMTAEDRALAEANQAEIARRAALQGIDLRREGQGEGSWGYEQAVCPVFPQHLILEYSGTNGSGDVTLFSAVVPRIDGRDGHVRVIPVRRRSYSLFTPASSNAITINDFNRLIGEGQEGVNPDWLTVGLCYAALAGARVLAALQAETAADQVFPLLVPAKLTVSRKGGAEVHFADATPHAKAMDWVLTFAQNGRLLKVRQLVSRELVEKPVPGAPQEVTKPAI